MSFLLILKLFYSKPFHNTLSYASTANIEGVMKFYNLGDKTFETDFIFSMIVDLGPVYTNTFLSKMISFSMKKQRLYYTLTSFSYFFHIVFSRLHENDENDWKW